MELIGLTNEEFQQEWRSRNKDRMNGHYANFASVMIDILTHRGLNINEHTIEYLYQQRIKEKAIPFRQVQHQIIDLLSSLKSNGVKLGLITNCTAEEVLDWNNSSISHYFDVSIFSYEIGISKPDERIYTLACDRLNVEPAETIFVGDGGSDELNGACYAGILPIHAVWFNTYIESDYIKATDPEMLKELINDLMSGENK